MVSSIAAELLATAPDPSLSKVRLLSASKKGSGSWLHTLPVTSLGLRMDDNAIHIAIGLCLGPHFPSLIFAITVDQIWTRLALTGPVVVLVLVITSAMPC